jgi:type I restriction enzyme S subunit
MIADLKAYPEYKESGLPWLGRVPGNWSVRRIKTVLRETDCRSTDGLGTLLSLTRLRGLIPHKDMTDKMHSAKTLVGYKRYSAGQLVMNRMQAWSGMFGAGEIDGLVSPDYAVFDVLGGHAIKLVLERLKTPDLVAQFALESKGIGSGFNRLYTDRFGPIRISLPPPEEQAAIVRFLDWANGRLELAIRAKRKVIVLLNEQKQAIIHRAVTRGLDPSVPLKPSGIPLLGDIPQHWGVEKAKNVFRLRTQKSGLAHGKELLSIYTHIGVRPRKDLEQKGNKASTTDDYWIVRKGDLIVNKLLAWMGAVGSSDYEGVTSPAYDILMPIRPLCSGYYHHLFRTKLYLQLFKQRSRGIMDMRLRLYFDQLGQIPVPFPPVDEQAAIVAFYVEATADLTATISRLEREINLLREYRTRLVADVVTGKLDVREAAARLPEEAAPNTIEESAEVSDEAEPADEEVAV